MSIEIDKLNEILRRLDWLEQRSRAGVMFYRETPTPTPTPTPAPPWLGPWSVADTDEGYQVLDGRGRTVAECRRNAPCGYQFTSVRLANAHLLAAAPDMLAALKLTLQYGLAFGNTERVRDAIKKAEGK